MKYIINERQYKLLTEEQEILNIPSVKFFGNWESLQMFLNRKGNPLYSIDRDLELKGTSIESLGNLTHVGGNLILYKISIESLGNLTSVGGNLNLLYTEIESFENLISVGRTLYIIKTPLAEKYSEKEIRQLVNVGKNILS